MTDEHPTAGWYPALRDGVEQIRWWDGTVWTNNWHAPPTVDVRAVDPRPSGTRLVPPTKALPSPSAADAIPEPGLGTLALLIALCIGIGLIVPFWAVDGGSAPKLSDSSTTLVTFLIVAGLGGLGAFTAMVTNGSGAFVMIGASLPFAANMIGPIRSLVDVDGLTAGAGFVLWLVAMLLGIAGLLAVPATVAAPLSGARAPGAACVLAGGGALLLGLSMLVPPADGTSMWEHASPGGDGWTGFANIVAIAAVPVGGLLFAGLRSQSAAAFLLGACIYNFAGWFVQAADIGDTAGAANPLLGDFALTTAALILVTGAALVGTFGPWFARESPSGGSPATTMLVLSLAALVLLSAVALVRRDDRLDSFGAVEPVTHVLEQDAT